MDGTKTQNVIACVTGNDKLQVFQEVLEHSDFFQNIEERLKRSGKDRQLFKIVIKPNFMVFLTSKDPSSLLDLRLEVVNKVVWRLWQ